MVVTFVTFNSAYPQMFDRAENRGSHREFENRNDEGTQRGFEFQLDANRGKNYSSATPSDCSDDDNSSNGEKTRTTCLTATATDSSILIIASWH